MVGIMSTLDFVKQAIKVHGNRYDYCLIKYKNMKTPVSIICKQHGVFKQNPSIHIYRKTNCPKCGYEQRASTRRLNNNWWTYTKAKDFVHNLKLTCIDDWNKFCNSGKRPNQLPAAPKITYKNEWEGWTSWIGINGRTKDFISFTEARKIVHSFNLRSCEDWYFFCQLDKRPNNIPFAPFEIYKSEWISWGDWLGYKSKANGNLPGIIYIIQQSNLPQDVYKIGRTYRLKKRLYEHNRIEDNQCRVIATFSVENMKQAEEQAHNIALLYGQQYSYRQSKEHFKIENIQQVLYDISKID